MDEDVEVSKQQEGDSHKGREKMGNEALIHGLSHLLKMRGRTRVSKNENVLL